MIEQTNSSTEPNTPIETTETQPEQTVEVRAGDPEADIDTLVGVEPPDRGLVNPSGRARVIDPVETPKDDFNWLTFTGGESEIDAALAAVSTLSDLVAEEEAAEEARREARRPTPAAYTPTLPIPPMLKLRRGSLGSVVPALALIGMGAWMTMTSTSGGALDPLLVAGAAVGSVVLSLLAYSLGAGRWARGTFFAALLIVAGVAVVAFSLQPGGIDLVRGYPLLLVASAAALLLTGFLTRPVSRRLVVPALLLLVAGGVGLAFTGGYLPGDVLPLIAPYAPVALVVLAVVWIAPLVFKRRG